VAPDGTLVASLPYGAAGVVAADLDLTTATRQLALRWSPVRSLVTQGTRVHPATLGSSAR
jgi:hypothetical protein